MKKIVLLSLGLIIAFTSCKNAIKEIDKVTIAKNYYAALNTAAYTKIASSLSNSITTIEGDYTQHYNPNTYVAFLKWDAVFEPTYKIVEIIEMDGVVQATISKMDKRIQFLHEKPFITTQTIDFHENKIKSIETLYVNFDENTWGKNKTALLQWIDQNHPELNGSINDLTAAGGKKFLKAIELYSNKK